MAAAAAAAAGATAAAASLLAGAILGCVGIRLVGLAWGAVAAAGVGIRLAAAGAG